MAAIVQRLERQIVVLDVEGSIPSSRPINPSFNGKIWSLRLSANIINCLFQPGHDTVQLCGEFRK